MAKWAMQFFQQPAEFKTLRERVEHLLPDWQAWYANLFDAACDLGLLRARVCNLSSLVLSRRHASVHGEALQAFREQWSVEEPEDTTEEERGRARPASADTPESDSEP